MPSTTDSKRLTPYLIGYVCADFERENDILIYLQNMGQEFLRVRPGLWLALTDKKPREIVCEMPARTDDDESEVFVVAIRGPWYVFGNDAVRDWLGERIGGF